MNWGGHYRNRSKRQNLCAGCGDYFMTTRRDAKTCSPKCRKRLQRVMEDVGVRKQIRQTAAKLGLHHPPGSPPGGKICD